MLLVALVLGPLVTVGPRVDGRSFGGFLAHSITCAARGGCHDGRDDVVRAHGQEDAGLLRRFAPGLVYEPGTYTLPVAIRTQAEAVGGKGKTQLLKNFSVPKSVGAANAPSPFTPGDPSGFGQFGM